MSKPPKVVIPGLNRGAGIPPGFAVGRRRGTGKGPAELLNTTQLRGQGMELVAASRQQNSSTASTALSSTTSLSSSISTVDSNQSTSLSQISSSLSGAISSTTSLSAAVSTVDSNQSTSLSQISSSLSGALSSTSSLSTAVSTVDSGQSASISSNLSKITSLSTAVSTVDSGQSTSLSQVSSSLSGAISSTTSLSAAVSTVDSNQSTSLSQISSSLSGAISSTTSLSAGLAAIAASGSASDLIAGTVPTARTGVLTGDVTKAAGASAVVVEQATPADGSFNVAGSVVATGAATFGPSTHTFGDATAATQINVVTDALSIPNLVLRRAVNTDQAQISWNGTSLVFSVAPSGSSIFDMRGDSHLFKTPGGTIRFRVDTNGVKGIGKITTGGLGGIGYEAGAGGAITQLTSKSTGVQLDTDCGKITMHNAALGAGAVVEFTVTNAQVAAIDNILLSLASGAAAGTSYTYRITAVAAGSFKMAVENRSAGSLSEALVFNFAVIKGAST